MARIRVCCPHCAGTALLRPDQVLLVPHPCGATYLYTCSLCEQVTDAAAGPNTYCCSSPQAPNRSQTQDRLPGPTDPQPCNPAI